MQTFLPYGKEFAKSAECLDNKRLGKQRVECLQILNSLLGLSSGWRNHPATCMWEGFEGGLCHYAKVICEEWQSRGFSDTVSDRIEELQNRFELWQFELPVWLDNTRLMDSHRSNLLRKFSQHYERFQWDVPNDLPYWWPI